MLLHPITLYLLLIAITVSANNATPFNFKIKEQKHDLCISPSVNEKGEPTGVKLGPCAQADTWKYTNTDGKVIEKGIGHFVSNRNFTEAHAIQGADPRAVNPEDSIGLVALGDSNVQRWRFHDGGHITLPEVGEVANRFCLSDYFGHVEVHECLENGKGGLALQLWEWG